MKKPQHPRKRTVRSRERDGAPSARRKTPIGRRTELGRYIVSDPEICHGQLTFAGTRIMVESVLELVAAEMDWDKIIWNCHDSISREAIGEAVMLARRALLERAGVLAPESARV